MCSESKSKRSGFERLTFNVQSWINEVSYVRGALRVTLAFGVDSCYHLLHGMKIGNHLRWFCANL